MCWVYRLGLGFRGLRLGACKLGRPFSALQPALKLQTPESEPYPNPPTTLFLYPKYRAPLKGHWGVLVIMRKGDCYAGFTGFSVLLKECKDPKNLDNISLKRQWHWALCKRPLAQIPKSCSSANTSPVTDCRAVL